MPFRIACLFVFLACSAASHAYGPLGHEMVGAIADELLAGTETATKVQTLLSGFTLARVASLPDQIKAWDRLGPENATAFHLPGHPKLEAELIAFWRANPPDSKHDGPTPSHHWFHYTDVPLAGAPEHYRDGATGRSPWDIVHMMGYCIDVLTDKVPQPNERKISKAVAVILLAHFTGDIHQPLHVGAEYFGAGGQPVNPDVTGAPGLEDQGGNTLWLLTTDRPAEHVKLHSFWDTPAVDAAFAQVRADMARADPKAPLTSEDLAKWFAAHEPKRWRPAAESPVATWPELWADDIMPLAREAHERLAFQDIKPAGQLAEGFAREKPSIDHKTYREWAGAAVRDELNKGGRRLAELLKRIL